MADEPFQFSLALVDDYIERVGADVQPPIEIAMEGVRIQNYFKKLSADHPNLFESLVMSATEWRIVKKFDFPGKGTAQVPTFSLSPRGPVFMIPRRLSMIGVETDLPPFDDIARELLEQFCEFFPSRQLLRVGKVHQMVFDCGKTDSFEIVADRFTLLEHRPAELRIRFNYQNDEYNRIFEIEPARRETRNQQGEVIDTGFAVKVSVDFNNCDMSKPLDTEDVREILADAQRFLDTEAFAILNQTEGGDKT